MGRKRIADILRQAFDVQSNRTWKATLLFLGGAISFGVLVNGLATVCAALSQCLMYPWRLTRAPDPRGALYEALAQLAVPLAVAVVVFAVMWRNYLDNESPPPVRSLLPPPRHRGLILLLSPYTPRRESTCPNLAVLEATCAQAPSEFRGQVLRSNWAPLLIALEHHLPAECWVIATQGDSGSAAQFEKAKTLLAEISPKTRFHLETVPNPYDLGLVVAAVHRIYDDAAHRHNIEPKEVIADFTGATAAMSGGVILATLSADRHLEYLRQDVNLLDGGVALSADRIRAACALVWIESSPGLADTPAKRAGRAE